MGDSKTAVMEQVQSITAAGELVGLSLKIDTIPFGVDSFYGHRLIHYARRFGKESTCEDILFRYILEENRDISDPQVLLQVADEVGLPDATNFLNSNEEVESVWLED